MPRGHLQRLDKLFLGRDGSIGSIIIPELGTQSNCRLIWNVIKAVQETTVFRIILGRFSVTEIVSELSQACRRL